MEALNILIFNWRCPKHPQAGGAEKVTYEVARRWVRWGHGIHLVCGNYPGGMKRDNIDGIEVTRLGGKYSLYPLAALHYLRKLRGKYDVIIDEINTVPFFTPQYVKEPKVAFIHQLAAEILYDELPWVQAKFWQFMEPRVLRLYGNVPVITVSQSTKEDLVKVGLPEENLHVITEGLDHDLYKPGGDKETNPHILYVGRLKRFKGVHFLIEAMRRVVQVLPSSKLSIVGRGEPEYERELKQLTKDLNLEDSVTFHGYVSEEEKIRRMQEAHVLVLPSQREGFGLVVIEANACGTPVVATHALGLRDSIIDGETGLLVPYEDVEALANAIIRVLSDEGLREELSRNAIEWAGRFSWEKTAEEFLKVAEGAVK
jgi:glycosyltransferase involved in cell wall biosynthesis